jgi:catechol-2,3-dioxygenase
MAEWEKDIASVHLMVGDLGRSKAFYQEVFGLSPSWEEETRVVFPFNNLYLMLVKG